MNSFTLLTVIIIVVLILWIINSVVGYLVEELFNVNSEFTFLTISLLQLITASLILGHYYN